MLGGEDTSEIDFTQLGMVKVLFVEPWQGSKIIADDINANDSRIKIMAMIEPDIEENSPSIKAIFLYSN